MNPVVTIESASSKLQARDTQKELDTLTVEELESEFDCELHSPSCVSTPVRWWVLCKTCGETLRGCEPCKALTDIIRSELGVSKFNCRICNATGKHWDDMWTIVEIGNRP